MAVKKGDKIKVEYEGTFDDGTVFDSSAKHQKPLEFEVGAGQVIKGFDEAVTGMETGEEKTIKLPPTEAYGEHNPQAIQKIPKDKIPQEVKEGAMLVMNLQGGTQFPVKVVKIEENEVTIDANHPLAGKTLNFKIKLLEISS